MAKPLPQPTQALNSVERNFYARTYSRAGQVTIDSYYPEAASALWVGTAGNLIVEGVDGVAHYFKAVPVGKFEFKHRRVLSAATIDGTPYTTNAADLTWLGGES
jgi:hypothetical protein